MGSGIFVGLGSGLGAQFEFTLREILPLEEKTHREVSYGNFVPAPTFTC
jgi:hypothetical protein